MDKNKIAVATMTWGRSEQEEYLLREALTILSREKIVTFVADGGSEPKFIQFLDGLSNFHTVNAASNGVFSQVKHSLVAAVDSGADFILYTEPDKKLFFDRRLNEFLFNAPSEENIGIVLASRSPASFATFPHFQQYTETVINNLCAEIIGQSGDYTYGPFIFNRNLIDSLDLVNHEIGWGWRPFLFAMAQHKGYKIVQLINDFPCPTEQQEDNPGEKIYRMKQLSQNIDGLVLCARLQCNYV
jgi:hypothetical protein